MNINQLQRTTEVDESDIFPLSQNGITKAVSMELVKGFCSGVELTGTLATGDTEITFQATSITENSTVDVYTTKYGVNPTDMEISTGIVTITFPEQEEDLGVKVRIS